MQSWLREIANVVQIDGGAGSRDLVAYFRDRFYFAELAVFEQTVWSEEGEQANVLGAAGPTQHEAGLLLCAPLRWVAPDDPAQWKENEGQPTRVAERGGRLYGCGVLSGRVNLLCMLEALLRVPAATLARPVWLAGMFGGELSAQAGTGLLLDHPHLRARAALLGAPTNLEIGVGHPGHLVFSVRIRRPRNIWRMELARSAWSVRFIGRASHGGLPGVGVNAARAAMEQLEVLARGSGFTIHNLSGGRGANSVPARAEAVILSQGAAPPWQGREGHEVQAADETLDLSYPVGDVLRGFAPLRKRIERLLASPPRFDAASDRVGEGAAFNLGALRTHADGLSLTYELRPGHDHDVEALLESLHGLVTEANARIEPLVVELEIEKDQPPFSPLGGATERELAVRLQRALSHAGVTPCEVQIPIHTEAWISSACGIETLVFGPGPIGWPPGAPGEAVSVQQLSVAIDVYEHLIRAYCCV